MYTPNKIQEFLRHYILVSEKGGFGLEVWMILTFGLLLIWLYLLWTFSKTTRHKTVFGILVAISTIALWLVYQIPNLATYSVYINECQHIAEGNRIVSFPIFWRQLDGTTLGPFPIYFLGLFKVLGVSIDYFTIKLINFVIWSITIFIVYRLFRTRYNFSDSLIFLSPLLAIVIFFSDYDYIGYNGEPFTVMLISIAVLLTYKLIIISNSTNRLLEFFLGIVLVSIPFSKFQGGPIAFVIGLYILACLITNKRSVIPLLSGVVSSLILLIVLLVSTDSLYDFWESYIINNISYTATSEGLNSEKGVIVRLLKLVLTTFGAPETRILFVLAVVLLFSFFRRNYRKYLKLKLRNFNLRSERLFLVLLLILSIFTVYVPGNVFIHYALFLIVPALLFVIKELSDNIDIQGNIKSLSILVVLVLLPGTMNIFNGNPIFSELVEKENAEANSVVQYLRNNAKNNDMLALWGWESCIYPDTGLLMATRESQTQRQIFSVSQQEYYLDRYLADIADSKPRFFLDTTERNNWILSYEKHNFRNYSELRNFIDTNYSMILNSEGMQLFERNSE